MQAAAVFMLWATAGYLLVPIVAETSARVDQMTRANSVPLDGANVHSGGPRPNFFFILKYFSMAFFDKKPEVVALSENGTRAQDFRAQDIRAQDIRAQVIRA